jgi:methyltransferase (TIGR00027 family)
MKRNTASRTAQYMAMFRGLESARPANGRLFTDPFAKTFLDAKLRIAIRMSSVPWIREVITRIIERKGPGALSSAIARTRYIDDLLEQTIRKGIKQVIILGAGFDTRAWRMLSLKNLQVTEIDHPDTASFKRRKLESIGQLPSNIRLLQIDFNKQSLEDIARENNLDLSISTTVIWEGVTNYISAGAVDQCFRFMSALADNSFIIFTYIDKLVLEDPKIFFGTDLVMDTLKKNEEHWTFGFDPQQLGEYLQGFGFHLAEDKSAVQYRNVYMPDRIAISRGYEFYHVAMACKNKLVKPSAL